LDIYHSLNNPFHLQGQNIFYKMNSIHLSQLYQSPEIKIKYHAKLLILLTLQSIEKVFETRFNYEKEFFEFVNCLSLNMSPENFQRY